MPPRGRKRKSDGNGTVFHLESSLKPSSLISLAELFTEDIAPTSPTPPEVVKKLPRRSNKAVKPLAEHAADDGRASARCVSLIKVYIPSSLPMRGTTFRSFLRAAASTKKRRLPACNAKKEVQKQADEILALSKKSGSVSL